MISKATLHIAEREYKLIRCCYSLRRDIDSKGRPSSGLHGGTITFILESSGDTSIIEAMTNVYKPIKGKVSFRENGEDINAKELLFEQAYIISYTEKFDIEVPHHMCMEFTLSAERLVMGKSEYKNEWLK